MKKSDWQEFELEVREERDSWRTKARCTKLGIATSVFYPDSEKGTKAAIKICSDCEVRTPCLEYAIATREENGVWGGVSEDELGKLIRRVQGVPSTNIRTFVKTQI